MKPLLDSKWPHDLSKPAAHYKNEVEVGEALAEAIHSGLVKREELFITTKVSLTLVLLLLKNIFLLDLFLMCTCSWVLI